MKNSRNSGRLNRNRVRRELKWWASFSAILLIPVLLAASFAVASHAAEKDGQIIIGDVSGCSGETACIPVYIQNNSTSIEQFGFDFLFCPDMLEFVSVERGELIPGWPFLEGYELEQGCVRMGGFSPENPIPPQSSAVLLYVNLTVTCDACSEDDPCELSIINPVDDVDGFSVQNGAFTYSCVEEVPCLDFIGAALLIILLSGMKFKCRSGIGEGRMTM